MFDLMFKRAIGLFEVFTEFNISLNVFSRKLKKLIQLSNAYVRSVIIIYFSNILLCHVIEASNVKN